MISEETKMKKLFELLAVERDLSEKASEAIKEAKSLFGTPDNYLGLHTVFHKLLEDQPDVADEHRELPNSVKETLEETLTHVGRFIDTSAQKEVANTTAFADVILDGEVFIHRLSATALLNLENKLEDLRSVYASIPTLTKGETWNWDSQEGCYVSDMREQIRTAKVNDTIIMYEATKEHPAQVQMVSVDKPAYKVERVLYSGMLTSAERKERLDKLERLQRAVKQARQRANTIEVEPVEIAEKVFAFIND